MPAVKSTLSPPSLPPCGATYLKKSVMRAPVELRELFSSATCTLTPPPAPSPGVPPDGAAVAAPVGVAAAATASSALRAGCGGDATGWGWGAVAGCLRARLRGLGSFDSCRHSGVAWRCQSQHREQSARCMRRWAYVCFRGSHGLASSLACRADSVSGGSRRHCADWYVWAGTRVAVGGRRKRCLVAAAIG